MKVIKIFFIVIGFILFFASAFLLFESDTDPTGAFLKIPKIMILNPDNDNALYSELDINFVTNGKNDLIITSKIGGFRFKEIKCGNEIINPSVNENMIEYKDYLCWEDSVLKLEILSEELVLDFKFGNEIEEAKNIIH